MPQLDFTIWLINLATCWSMFFLVFTSTQNIINNTNINNSSISNNNFNNINWPW
uniref:ATP synthase complex subunit 8 n=1 Tax=Ophiura albida TaxID=72672 RepID=B2FDM3_OPHAL|nr:ATP synthase F0 subunit 8 [Ophiura albida]CAL50578.1 ATPase subunit 8 [Ophiura albida]